MRGVSTFFAIGKINILNRIPAKMGIIYDKHRRFKSNGYGEMYNV